MTPPIKTKVVRVIAPEPIRLALRQHIRARYGTQQAAANHWGVTRQYVCAVLAGARSPTDAMLAEIGMKKVYVTRVQYQWLADGENNG